MSRTLMVIVTAVLMLGFVFTTTAQGGQRDDHDLTILMHDAYGDGWNGNVLTIGGYEFTLDTGSEGTAYLTLASGTYDVTCDGGSWQSEVSWEILDDSGAELLAGGAPYAGQLVLGEAPDGPTLTATGAEGEVHLEWTSVPTRVGSGSLAMEGQKSVLPQISEKRETI